MDKITTKESESEYLYISDIPLENHLALFHEVRGYKASAFTNSTGVLIAFDSLDAEINADQVGHFFCDMFNYTENKISKNGFVGCANMQLSLGDNLFLIFRSSDYSLITTRLVVLLSKEGNFSLTKITANKIIESLMNTITWSSGNYLLM